MDVAALLKKYRITDGKGFKLKDFAPEDCGGLKSKEEAQSLIDESVKRLAKLQEKLYAQDKWGIVVILQAMDAAGKDGAVKSVMTGVNPQGCVVHSFKAPTPEELDHDYLWRAHRNIPERGMIGIFNRSYYEDVLVVKVHPEWLATSKIPPKCIDKDVWENRYEDIASFERYLGRNGYLVRKFFLHVSKEEQKKRLLERLEESDKNWKFSAQDIAEREHWPEYMDAYEAAIKKTATAQAPWYVLPSDNKWYTRLLLASAIVESLESLDLKFPDVDPKKKGELKAIEKALRAQKD